MATSQNGWPADRDRSRIGVTNAFAPAGVSFPGGVKTGPVSVVLGYVAEQFHARVEELRGGWCWGFAYRDVRASTSLSNHASGTAIDVNAPRHPLGVRGTFTPRQRAEIHRILAEVDHTVRWGGDYSGRVDEMHFEINASLAAVARVAARLEDDMPTPQDLLNWPVTRQGSKLGGRTTLGAVVANIDRAWELQTARDAAILAAVTAISKDPGITPGQISAVVDQAVAEHTPTAEQIAAASRPAIADAVAEALGADNTEQADAIVDAIVDRLANPTTEEV